MSTFKNWVMQNHHLTSVSTSLQFFARQNFFTCRTHFGQVVLYALQTYYDFPNVDLLVHL